MKIEIAPSILSADFGKLNEEVAEVEPYSDRLHIDVMDGNFVPNISYGAPVYKWLKTDLPKDIHLMIEHPWKFLCQFAEAGGTTLIVHAEACEGKLEDVLKQIKDEGVLAGVSIKPKTGVDAIKDVLNLLDQVLVMTVEPGFGGQEFMGEMLEKVRELRAMGFEENIGVDGGINAETAAICRDAGANVLIAGSYVFGAEDRKKAVKSLRG